MFGFAGYVLLQNRRAQDVLHTPPSAHGLKDTSPHPEREWQQATLSESAPGNTGSVSYTMYFLPLTLINYGD